MSTPFYDLASLVVVPSGYKASKVYAQKPLTTDGQLAFTRSTTATRVNSAGLIEASAINVPRLDYLNSSCPRLLLEPQRSNLITYSEQFNNVAWGDAGITITANQAVSPDGSTNADLAVNSSSTNYLYQGLGSPFSGTYTVSIFAKKATQSSFAFGMVAGGFTGGMGVKFNFDTQTFSTPTNYANFTSISASYQSYGNGWYRLNLTGTTATSTTYFFVLGSLQEAFAVNAYVYGAQVEAGAYPTSLIPTTTAAITRGADAASKTGISSVFGATATTYFMDVIIDNLNPSGGQWTLTAATNSSNFLSLSQFDAGTRTPRFAFFVGGVPVYDYTGSALSAGRHKIAAMVKNGSQKFYIDGVLIASNTGSGYTQFDKLALNDAVWASPLQNGQFPFNQVLIFPTELTNAQLAELTTI